MKMRELVALHEAWRRLRDRLPFDGYSGEIKDKSGKVCIRCGEHPLKGVDEHNLHLSHDLETVLNALPWIIGIIAERDVR